MGMHMLEAVHPQKEYSSRIFRSAVPVPTDLCLHFP